MGRRANPAHINRNAEIARRYARDGKCPEDISTEFGLSRSRIIAILKAQGVELDQHRNGPPQVDRHQSTALGIGVAERLIRHQRGLGLTSADYGLLLGLSEPKVRQALAGTYNWRLNELTRVSDIVGVTVSQLVQAREWFTPQPGNIAGHVGSAARSP